MNDNSKHIVVSIATSGSVVSLIFILIYHLVGSYRVGIAQIYNVPPSLILIDNDFLIKNGVALFPLFIILLLIIFSAYFLVYRLSNFFNNVVEILKETPTSKLHLLDITVEKIKLCSTSILELFDKTCKRSYIVKILITCVLLILGIFSFMQLMKIAASTTNYIEHTFRLTILLFILGSISSLTICLYLYKKKVFVIFILSTILCFLNIYYGAGATATMLGNKFDSQEDQFIISENYPEYVIVSKSTIDGSFLLVHYDGKIFGKKYEIVSSDKLGSLYTEDINLNSQQNQSAN